MIDLKSKLSRLQGQSGRRQSAIQPLSAGSELRRRLDSIRLDRLSPPPQIDAKTTDETLAQRLKGYLIADGVIRIEQRLSLDGRLGRHPLKLLRNASQLPGEGREAHLRQVYIDTETTGLSGGSGTLAFLIGIAVVERDALVVTQYLITRFAGEPGMLTAFARTLTSDDRLVSYNGKSFDLPLMITRYRMQGLSHPFDGKLHLDLLHTVRRLFNRRWPDCRLATLEQRLLGFKRRNDLPGSEAPAAWTDYVRQGRAEKLVLVVEHNRQDIVSLALAHTALSQAIAAPESHGVDIVALARWISRHDETKAYTMLKAAAQPLDDRGKRLLGHLARRAGDWWRALPLWEELATRGCEDSMEQLAKYHEHISRDFDVASRYCKQLKPGMKQSRRLQRIEEKRYRQMLQPAMDHFIDR
ncbi:MAG: ribonuclease H-like domain-containing protein [Candidatus Thiodiazotropha sp.]